MGRNWLGRILNPKDRSARNPFEHLRLARKAYRRGEDALELMAREWMRTGAVCCPGCMFGDKWLRLARRQERRIAWIRILEGKLSIPPPPPPLFNPKDLKPHVDGW